jgi:hypothetical protein
VLDRVLAAALADRRPTTALRCCVRVRHAAKAPRWLLAVHSCSALACGTATQHVQTAPCCCCVSGLRPKRWICMRGAPPVQVDHNDFRENQQKGKGRD